MSIQELAVIKHFDIPVNIFLLNNSGYSMIKQTQDQWLGSKYAGSDACTDLTFPCFALIASSFGIEYQKVDTQDEKLGVLLPHFLDKRGPKLIEVIIKSEARVLPQVKFGRPNEDMEPLLDKHLFEEFMLIPGMRQDKP